MNSEILELEKKEFVKRDIELDFIASQNLCSENILDACSSISQMKYAEGFPGKRYYAGCEVVDEIETRCQEELLKLFKAEDEYYANVQPANGSSANLVAYRALLEPGACVLAPDVNCGGHISHSSSLSTIAQFYDVITYGLTDEGYIDYDEMERLAIKELPSMIIVGMSNYSRQIDYARVREIADKVDALVMADIAHISGLIATGNHPSPVGYADVITSTTHKILRGPRSAFMLYLKDYDKEVKRAQIPGCFGGPDEAKILAKLLCFKEAQSEEYKKYCEQVLKNAKVMVNTFITCGVPVLTGGTENHSFCLDLTDFPCSGRELADTLASAGVITNCNSIPNDKRSFFQTSGLRMGTPSVTTRGLKEDECKAIARCISLYLQALRAKDDVQASNTFAILQGIVSDCVSFHPLKNIYPRKYEELFKESYILN